MALEDAACLAAMADEADGDFPDAFRRYQALRIVRSARVQISSLLMDKIFHAEGVARLVRNSIFSGRTEEQNYDRLAWLYDSEAYLRSSGSG